MVGFRSSRWVSLILGSCWGSSVALTACSGNSDHGPTIGAPNLIGVSEGTNQAMAGTTSPGGSTNTNTNTGGSLAGNGSDPFGLSSTGGSDPFGLNGTGGSDPFGLSSMGGSNSSGLGGNDPFAPSPF